MPIPKDGETEKDFVSRCVPIVLDEGTTKDGAQAAAICHSLYKKHTKHSQDELLVRFTPEERVLDTNVERMTQTCVMGGEDLCADGLALLCSGRRIWGGADTIPLLWAHGLDIRGRFPLGSVRNIRTETIDGKPVNVGEKVYYQPGEAVKHLQSDLATMPSVIFDMRRQGHFKAVSEGFRVVQSEDREGGGVNATEWLLCELSDCPVGMDPIALDRAIRERSLNDIQKDWLVGRECRACGQCTKPDPQQVPDKASSGLDTVISALQTLDPRRVNG